MLYIMQQFNSSPGFTFSLGVFVCWGLCGVGRFCVCGLDLFSLFLFLFKWLPRKDKLTGSHKLQIKTQISLQRWSTLVQGCYTGSSPVGEEFQHNSQWRKHTIHASFLRFERTCMWEVNRGNCQDKQCCVASRLDSAHSKKDKEWVEACN